MPSGGGGGGFFSSTRGDGLLANDPLTNRPGAQYNLPSVEPGAQFNLPSAMPSRLQTPSSWSQWVGWG